MLDAFSRKNPATPDEPLTLLYDDVPQRIHTVARRSLHAHLIKLQTEERLAEQAESWSLVGI